MKYGIAEILTHASNLPTKHDQIAYLHKHDSKVLRTIIVAALDPNIIWSIPTGEVPYKRNQHLDQESGLYTEIRKLDLFIQGGRGDIIAPNKRAMLFVQFLEALSLADADMMVSIKDKKWPFTLPVGVIDAAFPDLLKIDVSDKVLIEDVEPIVEKRPYVKKQVEPMRQRVRVPTGPRKKVLKGSFPPEQQGPDGFDAVINARMNEEEKEEKDGQIS